MRNNQTLNISSSLDDDLTARVNILILQIKRHKINVIGIQNFAYKIFFNGNSDEL